MSEAQQRFNITPTSQGQERERASASNGPEEEKRGRVVRAEERERGTPARRPKVGELGYGSQAVRCLPCWGTGRFLGEVSSTKHCRAKSTAKSTLNPR